MYGIVGFAAPGGFYSSFVAERLDFVGWYRGALLSVCSRILHNVGYTNFVTKQYLQVINGVTVHLSYGCLGFGITSFWVSLALAFPSSARRKTKYLFLGLAAITTLNIIRVVSLAIVYSSPIAYKYQHVDHHFIANVVIYTVFFALLALWLKKTDVVIR